jgi:hypothetical protein
MQLDGATRVDAAGYLYADGLLASNDPNILKKPENGRLNIFGGAAVLHYAKRCTPGVADIDWVSGQSFYLTPLSNCPPSPAEAALLAEAIEPWWFVLANYNGGGKDFHLYTSNYPSRVFNWLPMFIHTEPSYPPASRMDYICTPTSDVNWGSGEVRPSDDLLRPQPREDFGKTPCTGIPGIRWISPAFNPFTDFHILHRNDGSTFLPNASLAPQIADARQLAQDFKTGIAEGGTAESGIELAVLPVSQAPAPFSVEIEVRQKSVPFNRQYTDRRSVMPGDWAYVREDLQTADYHWQYRATQGSISTQWTEFRNPGNIDFKIVGPPVCTGPLDIGVLTASCTTVSAAAQQYRADGVTVMPEGSTVVDQTVVLAVTPASSASGAITVDLEVHPSREPFTGSVVDTKTVSPGEMARFTRAQLVPDSYHWRYRARQGTATTGWTEFAIAGNTDFTVAPAAAPVLAVTSVAQYQGNGTALAEGGSANDTSVNLTIVPSSSAGGQVIVEVELRPIATAFTGSATSQQPTASGTALTMRNDSLVPGAYHWRYRVSQGSTSLDWKEYGTPGNTDFTVVSPSSPTLSIAGVGQYRGDGASISEGGSTTSSTVIFRLTPMSTGGGQCVVEIEVRPKSQAFTNAGTTSNVIGSGNELTLRADNLAAGAYHWQYHATSSTASVPWTEYGTAGNTDFTITTPSPQVPTVTSVGQFRVDGAAIPEGGTTSEGSLRVRISGTSASGNQLIAYAEVRPVNEAFHNSSTMQNTLPSGGAATLGTDAIPSGAYHWQYQLTDGAQATPWSEYGSSGNTDFSVVKSGPTLQVVPLSWNPVFTYNDPPASLPLQLSASSTLTGSITSDAAWLTVAGHSTYPWVTPEGITMTASPGGMNPATYNATLTIASSGASNTPLTIPVSMRIRPTLLVTTASLPDVASGQPYTATFQATGGTTYSWSIVGDLPGGLTLNPATGVISGTAGSPPTTPRTVNLTAWVSDEDGRQAHRDYTFQWRQGPTILIGIDNATYSYGTSYGHGSNLVYGATDGIPPYSWSADNLPPGLSIDSTGGIVGTPSAAGVYNATIKLTDSGSASATTPLRATVVILTLKITSGGQPPVMPAGKVGVAYTYNLNATGGAQSGFVWHVTGALPNGITAQSPPPGGASDTLLFGGTPAQSGTFPLHVTVTDPLAATASADLSLVINTTDPPHITTTSVPRAIIGTAYATTFAATGGTLPYMWSLVSSPDPGLTLGADGTLHGSAQLPGDCNPGRWTGSAFNPPKQFTVQVTDANHQASSAAFCLVSYYPTPTLTSITPPDVTSDGATHTFSVIGTGFRNDTVVLPTINYPLLMDNHVIAYFYLTVPSSTNATFSTYPSLVAPVALSPDGSRPQGAADYALSFNQVYSDQSNTLPFSIYDPPPVITSIVPFATGTNNQPCHAGQSCQLIINGTGFSYETAITLPGTNIARFDHPNVNVPWTQLTTSAFGTSATTYTLTLTNPHQRPGVNGTTSGQFTINP